jgi:hypothetical protein
MSCVHSVGQTRDRLRAGHVPAVAGCRPDTFTRCKVIGDGGGSGRVERRVRVGWVRTLPAESQASTSSLQYDHGGQGNPVLLAGSDPFFGRNPSLVIMYEALTSLTYQKSMHLSDALKSNDGGQPND